MFNSGVRSLMPVLIITGPAKPTRIRLNYQPNAGKPVHQTLGTHEQQSVWEIPGKAKIFSKHPQPGRGNCLLNRVASWVDAPWRRGLLVTVLPGSYFGGIWLGALHFPRHYDWRRNVISNLLSSRDNPGWYRIPCAGVAISGVCMLLLAAWIDARLGDGGSRFARRVRRPALLGGALFLTLAALMAPQHAQTVAGLRHAHEALARIAAAGLGVGIVCSCWCGAQAGMGAARGRRVRLARWVWRLIALPPLALAAGCGVLVGLGWLHWVPAGDSLRGTLFWHLAFWEWLGSALMFLYFASAAWLLGGEG